MTEQQAPATWDDVVTAAFRTTIDRAARGVATLDERALLRTYAEALLDERALLRRERDLAIAHDRQPYPTAHAYEQACKALNQHRERAEQLAATLREVLHTFTLYRHTHDGTRIGYQGATIDPADYDRWHAVLEPAKEQH